MIRIIRRAQLTRPHDFIRRGQLKHLANDLPLAVWAEEGEDLPKVKVYVIVDGGEVPRLLRERVAGMQQDDFGARIRLDEGLQVCGRRQRQGNVAVSQARVELH